MAAFDGTGMNTSNTAVLFIEFQNEFCSEGGKLNGAVKECQETKATVTNAVALAAACRAKGIPVWHAPITFSDDFRELSSTPYGILAGVKGGECFKASAWGGQMITEMLPADGEVVVSGKRGLCAFASTNLDFMLRQRGIIHLALCGYLTNCCVESTMRTAYEKGYTVFTLTDCCAATSVEAHDMAVKHTFPMFSNPMTSVDFVSAVGQK